MRVQRNRVFPVRHQQCGRVKMHKEGFQPTRVTKSQTRQGAGKSRGQMNTRNSALTETGRKSNERRRADTGVFTLPDRTNTQNRAQMLVPTPSSAEAAGLALELLRVGVVLSNEEGIVLSVNDAARQLLGLSGQRMAAMSRRQLIVHALGLLQPPYLGDYRVVEVTQTNDGADIEVQGNPSRFLRWVARCEQHGEAKVWLDVFTDVTQEVHQVRERERLAMTDVLTSLPNRRAGEASLSRESARARRDGTDLSVILFDVDHFKRVNDTYGHAAGDEALRVVACVLSGAFRESDAICRWGGEEFLAILPNISHADAFSVAERVRRALSAAQFHCLGGREGDEQVRLTVSAGIAAVRPGEDPACAVARADRLLYEAKSRGRNQVVG